MTFGKAAGPPASDKQAKYLLALVRQAGYDDFRDARRPLGLTQRQGSGKFTVAEASELIDQLLASGADADGPAPTQATLDLSVTEERLGRTRGDVVRGLPADVLATELERRGWTVTPP